jgi:hypothetical protein
MRLVNVRVTLLLVCGLFGCSSGGGTGVDASGSGGESSHAGSSGGGGASSGGASGARGQAGDGATGGATAGASGAGHSGSQGGATATGAGGLAQGGAGGSAPQPDGCNVSYNCPVGQTCNATGGANFACVPSGPGKPGDACDYTSATVACGDQLICAVISTTTGMCYQFCDSGHPCPTGKTCTTFASQATQFLNLCV